MIRRGFFKFPAPIQNNNSNHLRCVNNDNIHCNISSSCFFATVSNFNYSSFKMNSSSSNNNNNNNHNNAETTHQPHQQQQQLRISRNVYFVSQNGNYFFTDVAFSCIRNIKDTLITVFNSGTHTSSAKASSSLSVSPSGGSLKLGDVSIASQARNLHAYSPSNFFEAISKGRIGSFFSRSTKNNSNNNKSNEEKSDLDKNNNNNKSTSSKTTTTSSSSSSCSTSSVFNESNQPPLPSSFARRKWWYAMMPTGYPHSVSQGFARFFVLNLAGAALAAFSLTLATQALLTSFFAHGSSVGWLLKDILPAFLTAYLAHTFINVETHPREWFIVANMMTQGAVCFDFLIPFIADSPWVTQTVSAVLDKKAVLVGLAAGSSFVKGLAMLILTTSRTALVQSFSREGNLIELSKRLHGMIILIYPTSSGVALAVAALIGHNAIGTIATLVVCASLGVVSISVMMVRNLYPRLLNVENATESIRRFLKGAPVVRAAEAPSVALFARRIYRVPFRVGFDLDSAIHRASKYGEAIAVVSFEENIEKAKYLFVFRRPGKGLRPNMNQEKADAPQYYTMAQVQQMQYETQQNENDIVSPRKFVGILFDVHANFNDVVEGLTAAIMFREHHDLSQYNNNSHHHRRNMNADEESPKTDETTPASNNNYSSSNLSNEYCHADLTDAFPLSRKKGTELLEKISFLVKGGQLSLEQRLINEDGRTTSNNNTSSGNSGLVFLRKPKQSELNHLIQQLSQAGWQTRPHQIDNRDFRIEIQQLTYSLIRDPLAPPVSPSPSTPAAVPASTSSTANAINSTLKSGDSSEPQSQTSTSSISTATATLQTSPSSSSSSTSSTTRSGKSFTNLQNFGELDADEMKAMNLQDAKSDANTKFFLELEMQEEQQKRNRQNQQQQQQDINNNKNNQVANFDNPTDAVKPCHRGADSKSLLSVVVDSSGRHDDDPNSNRKILKRALRRIVDRLVDTKFEDDRMIKRRGSKKKRSSFFKKKK